MRKQIDRNVLHEACVALGCEADEDNFFRVLTEDIHLLDIEKKGLKLFFELFTFGDYLYNIQGYMNGVCPVVNPFANGYWSFRD